MLLAKTGVFVPIETLELRALLSATYLIDGVQPASYDQPQIHALFRATTTGTPLTADDGAGNTSFDITGFLDTGSSGIVISQETAQALAIQSSTFNNQTVTYEDVGIGGADQFDVSQPLYLNVAPFNETVDGTSEADFSQKFGPIRVELTRTPADTSLGDPLDIFGIPAMQGKVVVMDPRPVNDLSNMRTWLYNPGTAFHSATQTTDPGIPATNLHVKLSNASLQRYTDVVPAGAPGPVFSSNPFIGPAPGVSGDTTPAVSIGEGGLATSGSFLLDTGSQGAFISTAMAAKVHVYYQAGTEGTDNPVLVDGNGKVIPNQFSFGIGGIGGAKTVAGFYLDSLTLPTREGTPIKYTHAPVLVTDVTVADPKTGATLTLDGDIGMNYFVASSAIAGGTGDDHPGDYNWITFDQTNAVLGLDLPGVTPVNIGSISGTTFKDINANGRRDTGEGVLASTRVCLDTNKNGKFDTGEPTALTDATGAYHLNNLAAGTYRVREVAPGGWQVGTPTAGYVDVIVTAGQDIAGKDFANLPVRAAISGSVFNDLNANATRQTGEAGLAGWRVYLDTNNNAKLDTVETSVLTDAAGNYSFTGLLPGSYTVRDVLSTGWRATTAAQVVTLAGINATGRLFGATQTAKLTGVVFLDPNRNGLQDKGEASLSNWRVYIDANNNGKFDTGETSTLTNSAGLWTFSALAAGKYVVRIVESTGYAATLPTAGAYALTLTAGSTTTRNFGQRHLP